MLARTLLLILGGLGVTYRVRRFDGLERWKRLQVESSPVILAAWHNRLFFLSIAILKDLMSKGFKMTIMSSLSRDGEVGAIMGRLKGVRVVRGSPTKGGTAGFRNFYRVMKREKRSVIILPDGSKGPKYVAKKGVVVLAQLSGNPIVPISYTADRYWRIGSWDRMIIPKPFARISIAVGEDIRVSRNTSSEGLEIERQRVEDALMELNRRVDSLAKEDRKNDAF